MKSYPVPALLVIILTIISSCEPKSGKKVKDNVAYEYYDNGRIKTEAQVIDDTLANGLYKKYTPDGYLESVYTYVKGKRQGPAVTYYNNGQLRTRLYFKDNKLNGQAKMYYKTGELYRVTNYVDGNAEGIRTSYYKNGKVMAEVPYKNNYPGIGFKEYTEDGKLEKDTPKILIKTDNRLALEDKYILQISLSPRERATTFYIGDLEDGKYIHAGLWPKKPVNGTYEYVLNVHKGGFLMETLTISATYQTHHNNWAVVSRKYNLAIDNK